jgi:hypothetical protein
LTATANSLTSPGRTCGVMSRSHGTQTPLCVPANRPLTNTLTIQFVPEKCSRKPRPAAARGPARECGRSTGGRTPAAATSRDCRAPGIPASADRGRATPAPVRRFLGPCPDRRSARPATGRSVRLGCVAAVRRRELKTVDAASRSCGPSYVSPGRNGPSGRNGPRTKARQSRAISIRALSSAGFRIADFQPGVSVQLDRSPDRPKTLRRRSPIPSDSSSGRRAANRCQSPSPNPPLKLARALNQPTRAHNRYSPGASTGTAYRSVTPSSGTTLGHLFVADAPHQPLAAGQQIFFAHRTDLPMVGEIRRRVLLRLDPNRRRLGSRRRQGQGKAEPAHRGCGQRKTDGSSDILAIVGNGAQPQPVPLVVQALLATAQK